MNTNDQLKFYENSQTRFFQGFRFLFIMAIVIMHAGYPILGNGADLCSFFFVLSGFLYKKKNNKNPLLYIYKKIEKTYSVYWFCFALFLIVNFLIGELHFKLRILPHIFLLQSLVPSTGEYYFEYVGTAWFLSSLFVCYVLSPYLSKLQLLIGTKYAFVLSLSLLLLMYFSDWGNYKTWLIYISPYFRICEYFMGLCLSSIVTKIKPVKSNIIYDIIIIGIYFIILNLKILGNLSSLIHLAFIFYLYTFRSSLIKCIFGHYIFLIMSIYLIFIYLVHMIIFVPLIENVRIGNLEGMFISIIFSVVWGGIYYAFKSCIMSYKSKLI